MQDAQTCTSCGAKNTASAPWCTQCYLRFGAQATAAAPVETPVSDAIAVLEGDPVPPLRDGTMEVGVRNLAEPDAATEADGMDDIDQFSGGAWTCKTCDTVNPVEKDLCTLCGNSIFQTFGGGVAAAPVLSSQEALKVALVPGWAHFKMGYDMHGLTIAVLIGAVLLMSVLLILGGQIAMGLVMIVLAIAILAGSMHDAVRLSENRPDAILLKPRILTVIGGAAVMLVIAVIWNQGLVS